MRFHYQVKHRTHTTAQSHTRGSRSSSVQWHSWANWVERKHSLHPEDFHLKRVSGVNFWSFCVTLKPSHNDRTMRWFKVWASSLAFILTPSPSIISMLRWWMMEIFEVKRFKKTTAESHDKRNRKAEVTPATESSFNLPSHTLWGLIEVIVNQRRFDLSSYDSKPQEGSAGVFTALAVIFSSLFTHQSEFILNSLGLVQLTIL